MPEWISGIWTFLTNPENQATLTWIGGAIVGVTSAAWGAYRVLWPKPPEGRGAGDSQVRSADGRSNVAGGSVTIVQRNGLSGVELIIVLVILVGALVAVAGLIGDRIVANGGAAIGGDVSGSEIIINNAPTQEERQ